MQIEQILAAPHCPYCDRVMSHREAVEQDACNDCYPGGTWDDTSAR